MRSTNVLWALTAVLLLTSVRPAAAQLSNTDVSLPTSTQLARFGLERAWWGQATLNPSRDRVAHMVADEEQLYVQATSGTVSSFDNETGKRLWSVQLGVRDEPSYPAVSNESTVLVVAGIRMYALDKVTGKILWQLKLPNIPSTSPAVDNSRIYLGMLDGSVYAFDLKKIDELYHKNLLPQWTDVAILWRFKTAKRITTPPISTGLTVLFASMDRSMYSVNAETRKQLLQFETDAPISAPLTYSDGYVFMASEDFNMYCFNAQTGQLRWQARTGLRLRKPARVIDTHVFLLPLEGGMYDLSADRGLQHWWRPEVTEFLAASQDLVYASDEANNLMIIDRTDGGVRGLVSLPAFTVRVPNDRTDRIFVGTPTGLVMCLREQGRQFPLYHQLPERRPIMPLFTPEPGQPDPLGEQAEPPTGELAPSDAAPAAEPAAAP